jgi:hypothetical protein
VTAYPIGLLLTLLTVNGAPESISAANPRGEVRDEADSCPHHRDSTVPVLRRNIKAEEFYVDFADPICVPVVPSACRRRDLTGCAPTLAEVADRYSGFDRHDPVALERFRVRHNDCRRMSRNVVNIGGGLLGAAANVANAATAHDDFTQCMIDGGYTYIPTQEEREAEAESQREHCRQVTRGRGPQPYAACLARLRSDANVVVGQTPRSPAAIVERVSDIAGRWEGNAVGQAGPVWATMQLVCTTKTWARSTATAAIPPSPAK